MQVSAAFDSGNIEVVEVGPGQEARLRIRPDPPTETPDGTVQFAQWFHFRVVGPAGQPRVLRILDANKAAYPDGWPGYQVVASHDQRRWFRVATTYDGAELRVAHTPEADATWYAYFAPYSWDRHQSLIAEQVSRAGVSLEVLGLTLDGRTLDCLRIGERGPVVWVIARQHPGESMAEWWMEGFLGRLTDPHDALAGRLRGAARWCVVPNMNPDGSVRGHLRTNAAGANLNREWATPSLQRSPEVWHVRRAMDTTGVQICLDVHGDEGLPYNFIAGAEGIPDWTATMAARQDLFKRAYERANPDFQRVHGYPPNAPRTGNLTMCTNHTAQRYGCLAMTLEQPFKDNLNNPDPAQGWSPERAMRLGASALDAFAAVLAELSAEAAPTLGAEA
jgi:murein tripeptide amidase MpaA